MSLPWKTSNGSKIEFFHSLTEQEVPCPPSIRTCARGILKIQRSTLMDEVFYPTRVPISVEQYERMTEVAIFDEDDRIELIEGELLTMAPLGG